MRPRIGVTAWHHHDGQEQWEYIRDNYTRAVTAAGGLPFILPIAAEPDLPADVVGSLDGLLLTGGEDVHPSFYGENVQEKCGRIDESRDRFELALTRAALARGLPILAICRGMQVVNVACGGTLYQDLAYRPETASHHTGVKEERARRIHPIKILPGTRLREIVGLDEASVTSTHHQVIREVAPGFRPAAIAADGVLEGMERVEEPLALAVQWHPERLAPTDPAQLNLFRALVEEAAKRARR
ncbi:MAG TPA: gamma-glutamyl-gamma-aminobutyrate hydrolase family protein [Candidatus Methylomirabilis sp.]|jgi:putative glutamine amidotransferase|nr:gamma-glutamyl-gamma-aminobutyrate hydrolase family protein [Candidatus Methylomirabilis sp.]